MHIKVALEKAAREREQAKRTHSHHTSPKRDVAGLPQYTASIHLPFDPKIARNNRCVSLEPDSAEASCYKVLRTKIHLQAQKKNLKTVAITSPCSGEGKTLTTVNLALSFAQAYDRTVLVVDCDLKRQGVHKILGIDSRIGLTDYLLGARSLPEVIVWPGIEKLTLISGGGPSANSAELLDSHRMKDLVAELKNRYDNRIILFDTAPLLGGADTLSLLPLADCTIMVVAEGKTIMSDIRNAMQVVPTDKFLGFVVNRQRKNASGSYNYYY